MAELKPCPFCGGKQIRIYAYDPFDGYQGNLTVHRVHCIDCGAQVQKDKVMDAIEAWNRREKMPKLKIVEIRPDIRKDVEANNGYCPCAIWQTEDTKCMCKEFREQDTPGECQCGRFEKVVEEMRDAESQAAWIICPFCDEKKCVGRYNCKTIAAYIKRMEEKEKRQ